MENYKSAFALIATLMFVISTQVSAADITIKDAYVRAVAPGQTNSAAYMTIHNHAAEDRTLVAIESPAAEGAELHENIYENDMVKMRRVEGGLTIKAQGMVTLQPGRLHLMLIGLKQKLVPGEMIQLTFKFNDGTTQQFHAEIRKPAMTIKKDKQMEMPQHQHNMH